MIKYDMIAVDLDDSLLGNDLRIGVKNRQALGKYIEEGGIVTIATGRMYGSAIGYAQELDIKWPIISFNGAFVKNPVSGEVVMEKPVPMEQALKIIKLAEQRNIQVNAYYDGKYYIEKDNKYTDYYWNNSGIQGIVSGKLSEFVKWPLTKLIYIDEPERINELYDELKYEFENINVFITKPMYLEFVNQEASKGIALKALASYYGIKRERIIAIGDSTNDISMIEYAGFGVAMGNSRQEVKQAADYVTLSNEEEGVAEVINRFAFVD